MTTTRKSTTKPADATNVVAVPKSARARAAAKTNGKPVGQSRRIADPDVVKNLPLTTLAKAIDTAAANTKFAGLAPSDQAAFDAGQADPVAKVVDAANQMTDSEWESTDIDPNPELTARYLTLLEAATSHNLPIVDATIKVVEPIAFAEVDRTERLRLMKAEQDAVRAWKIAGSFGDAPERPVSNAAAMELLDNGGTVGAPAVKATGKGHSRWAPDAEARLVQRISDLRDDGKGWPAIAKLFNEEGVATAKGGKWASSTVMGIGKRHGLPTTRPAA